MKQTPSRARKTRENGTLERLAPFLSDTQQYNSARWSRVQKEYMLDVFRTAARYVPAYASFLKKNGCTPKTIKSEVEFKRVPPMRKANYLRNSDWDELTMPGALAGQPLVMTATSGSTGKSFYFPRTSSIDEQAYVYHRAFLHNANLDPDKPTLVIVAFGMGVWIGGIITYEAFKRISERDFPLTIITPGVNKKEIFDALREIGPHYQQLLLCGYPPFIKDLIDDAPQHGVKWQKFDLRVICAAETFSEDFRTYISAKTGMRDRYRDIMNIYGSAELGTMATETPLTILLRELSLDNPRLFGTMFGQATRLPTLAQYVPSFVSFEAIENRIYCTAGNALPLVRYEIGDHGGVHTFAEIVHMCAQEGIDIRAEARKRGIHDTLRELPLVYVYERADLSTKLFGAIIYPEHVRSGLMEKHLHGAVTGRFTMFTKTDIQQDEYLEINVELQPGKKETPRLLADVTNAIVQSLEEKNAEHKNNMKALGDRVRPRIVFWAHNHPEHFSHGGKHQWVKK